MSWQVDELTVRFGHVTALERVGLEIRPGRVHGVIGGDGAGKSTLLRVLVGLTPADAGRVRLPPTERIGFVPSDGGVIPDLTVAENVEFVSAAHHPSDGGAWRRRADELLTRAGIAPFADRLAGHLSGGQRRKLAGCLALLPRPDLLVLDEMTTGVDPVSRMDIWRLVADAAADGAAVVISTTYLDEAERMEHILLLHEGRPLATGTPQAVVDAIPGSVVEVDAPTDPARAWRAGQHWRQWRPDAPPAPAAPPPRLEDAAIVLELAASAPGTSSVPDSPAPPAPTTASPRHHCVTARGLTRRFGDFTAVDGIDLHVDPGEIVGLLGANGAGKTTVVRMVLGLLTADDGTIALFGRPHGREQRRRIGYVPQGLGLYADLTAEENREFRADVFDVRRTRATGGGDGDLLVRELPLGVQRRLAFEVATQHDPELLVLDEPTSGVSPLARSHLWDLIHRRADRGAGVLVSTHYMDEAEQADRLVVMSQGRQVATGSLADVLRDRTTVEIRADRWADVIHTLDRPGRRLRLDGRRVRVLGAEATALGRELDDAGIDATVALVPATLDEVLIELDRSDR
jgi:ABC-2 type transport system ATP-binding protein